MKKNGTYLIAYKNSPEITYKLISHNGVYKIFKPLFNGKDEFIRNTSIEVLKDNFKVVKTLKTTNRLFDIEWVINGIQRELIKVNGTYPLVKWKIDQLKHTYKPGLLKMIPA